MKREKTKRLEAIITEGQKIKKVVKFNGAIFNLILHMKLYTYPTFSFELIDKVTNESGNEVEGIWFWGTQGNNHRERLEFDLREGENYLHFNTIGSWCNGRIKNGRKTLRDIVEKIN